MKLGATTLPGCRIESVIPTTKQVIHDYDWSDECSVTDLGAGPTIIRVRGICSTEAERTNVITATEAARSAVTELLYPSTAGTDDRYYRVYTSQASWKPITADVYEYTFTATAIVPYIYDDADDSRVT